VVRAAPAPLTTQRWGSAGIGRQPHLIGAAHHRGSANTALIGDVVCGSPRREPNDRPSCLSRKFISAQADKLPAQTESRGTPGGLELQQMLDYYVRPWRDPAA
jgi:hypothetical protein